MYDDGGGLTRGVGVGGGAAGLAGTGIEVAAGGGGVPMMGEAYLTSGVGTLDAVGAGEGLAAEVLAAEVLAAAAVGDGVGPLLGAGEEQAVIASSVATQTVWLRPRAICSVIAFVVICPLS